jgi:hypothetical protein
MPQQVQSMVGWVLWPEKSVLLLNPGAPPQAVLLCDWVGDFPLGGTPDAIIAAAFNRAGHLDLATPTHNEQAVEVLLGDGTGSLGQIRRLPITGDVGRPRAIVAADFNRNETLVLAVTTIQAFVVPNYVSVLLGAGNGSFGPETLFRVGTEHLSLATGDFTRDTVQDLVTANRLFRIVDFNEDGTADIALSKQVDSSFGDFLSVCLGHNTGEQSTDVDEITWAIFLPAILRGAKTR